MNASVPTLRTTARLFGKKWMDPHRTSRGMLDYLNTSGAEYSAFKTSTIGINLQMHTGSEDLKNDVFLENSMESKVSIHV
jgi:hypothetical protein